MKKVIFLCLLSLTLCLSKPSEPVPAPNTPPAVNNTPEQTTPAPAQAVPTKTQSASTQTTTEAKPAPAPTTTTTGQPAQKEEQKPSSTATPTDNNTGKDAVPPKGNEDKKNETSGLPPNKSADVKPSNETKPDDKKDDKQDDKKSTTTVAPVTPASASTEAAKTETPAKADEDKHMVQARGFDGPSFMGGIILTLGLLAIGFMGFKYYKNQTERNYHTL